MRPELPETRAIRILNLVEMLNPDRIVGETGRKELEGFGLGPKLREFTVIWQELKRDAETRAEQLKRMMRN